MECHGAFSAYPKCFLVFQAANIHALYTIKACYRFTRNQNGNNVNIRFMKN